MASRYSKVQSTLFNSEKFRKLNDFQKNVYVYLLISPHGNSAGFYKLNEGYAAVDLNCTIQRYKNALQAIKDVGLIEYDGDIIFIRQFLKFNPYTNPKHAQGSYREIEDLIDNPLYSLFYEDVKAYCIAYIEQFPEPKKAIDSLSIGYAKAIETPRPIPRPIPYTENNILPGAEAAPVCTLTLNDKSEYPIYQQQVDEWKELYPAVDVMQELRNMKGWLISNPRKRKTRTGILRFVNGWLAREQNKGGVTARGQPNKPDNPALNYTKHNWEAQELEALFEEL